MKKICEIYDISKDYDSKAQSIYIVVSDLDQQALIKMHRLFSVNIPSLMTQKQWQQYLSIDKTYNRNESKHLMREKRSSSSKNTLAEPFLENDPVIKLLENQELTNKIGHALSKLKEPAKKRFLKYYTDHLTYREIAKEEGKAVSTIYESIKTARKKFLKNF